MADTTLSAAEQKYLNEQFVVETKKFYDATPTTEPAKIKDREDLIKGYEEGRINADVVNLLNIQYNNRRLANYPEVLVPDFDNVIKDNTQTMDVIEESNWNFRLPKDRAARGWSSKDETKERLVVNAKQDASLIEEMDKFCAKYKCYYKTPDSAGWNERIDTLVLYCKENISPEMQADFLALVSPFIRNDIPEKTNALDGEKIGDGIFKAKEQTHADIQAFLGELRAKLPGHIVDGIEASIDKTNPAKWKWSLGQFATAQEFVDEYLKKFPQKTTINDEELTDENKITEEERAYHRSNWEAIAERDNLEYVEDKEANIFKAVLKNKENGETLKVEAAQDKFYFSARDKDGNRKVPDQKYFEDVVEQIRKKGHVLKLADNIQGPEKAEFKARLIIACLKAEPQMYITNLTEVNGPLEEETKTQLNKLLEERKKKLEGEKTKEEPEEKAEKTDEGEEITSPEIQKMQKRIVEIDRNTSRTDLEKAELGFYSQRVIELQEKIQLKETPELIGKHQPGWRLGFKVNLNHKTMEDIAAETEDYLKSIKVGYKKVSLENKDKPEDKAIRYEIYAGSHENKTAIINDLDKIYKKIGGNIKDFVEESVSLSETQQSPLLMVNGFEGLSEKTTNALIAQGIKIGILEEGTKYPADKNEKLSDQYKVMALESYVAHKYLESKVGDNYNNGKAKDLDDHFTKIIGLTPAQKKIWDRVAKNFKTNVDMNDKDIALKSLAFNTAKKLDFSKSTLAKGTKTKPGGRGSK